MSVGGVSVVDDISRQIGKLEGTVEALTQGVGELRAENARDHAEVVASIERLGAKLEAKADNIRVDDHALRIDSLEQTRDKGRGFMLALVAIQSTLLLASAVLSVLAATGNL